MTTPRIRRNCGTAFLLLLAILACNEGPVADVDHDLPPIGGLRLAAMDCVAYTRTRELACGSPQATSSASAGLIFGGQHHYVVLRSGPPTIDRDTFRFDMSLESLVGQPLGTVDGVSADSSGVRVFFTRPPTVLQGAGAVSVVADGWGAFTRGSQPYYQYAMLDSGVISPPREWKLVLPATVEAFQFSIAVSAAVPHPAGFISVTAERDSIDPGEQLQLVPIVRSALGQPLDEPLAVWSSSDTSVASVQSDGTVHARRPGTAIISATAGDVGGHATIHVRCTGPRQFIPTTMRVGARFSFDYGANSPHCMNLDAGMRGQQYLVYFEDRPVTGNANTGLFPGPAAGAPASVHVDVYGKALRGASAGQHRMVTQTASAAATFAWRFGHDNAHEMEPGTEPHVAQRISTSDLSIQGAAGYTVGDTVLLNMPALQWLGIPAGSRKAVVRQVSGRLVIAEDVRLHDPAFTRERGGRNAPLTEQDLAQVAAAYHEAAEVQGDLLFDDRYNNAIDQDGHIIAVHSMLRDGFWGFANFGSNYFVFDFWVTTNGSTRTVYQQPHVLADRLFAHEIAHLRHWGIYERAGSTPAALHRWIGEGFGAFVERLSNTQRLLNTIDAPRRANLRLPGDPALGGFFFYGDVPEFREMTSSIFGGYGASSYLFDYLADRTTNWRAATRDLLLNAVEHRSLDATIARYLPGTDFGEFVSRARTALYTEDLPLMPEQHDYLQFQLRASRPVSLGGTDPRTTWPRLTTGQPSSAGTTLTRGAAWGVTIDADHPGVVRFGATAPALIHIVRLK